MGRGARRHKGSRRRSRCSHSQCAYCNSGGYYHPISNRTPTTSNPIQFRQLLLRGCWLLLPILLKDEPHVEAAIRWILHKVGDDSR